MQLDGQIARKWPNQASKFGSFLDPMADKLLVGSLVISMSICDLIPMWLMGTILFRDVFLLGAGFVIRYISLPPPVSVKLHCMCYKWKFKTCLTYIKWRLKLKFALFKTLFTNFTPEITTLFIYLLIIKLFTYVLQKTFTRYFDATHVTAQLEPTLISKINTGVQLATIGISLGAPIWSYLGLFYFIRFFNWSAPIFSLFQIIPFCMDFGI